MHQKEMKCLVSNYVKTINVIITYKCTLRVYNDALRSQVDGAGALLHYKKHPSTGRLVIRVNYI